MKDIEDPPAGHTIGDYVIVAAFPEVIWRICERDDQMLYLVFLEHVYEPQDYEPHGSTYHRLMDGDPVHAYELLPAPAMMVVAIASQG